MNTASPKTPADKSLVAHLALLMGLIWCSLPTALVFASLPENTVPVPAARAFSSMQPGLRRQLDAAFDLAHQAIDGVPACRRLFSELDQPASLSLRYTLYVPASGLQEQRICARGVSAFTEVGSRVTYLCRGFGRLAAPQAAMTLVHEALHLAGLEEAPNLPDALSSAEINGLVASSCRL